MGVADRVLTLSDAIAMLRALHADLPNPPPAVRRVKTHELNLGDPIFDGLKEDYGQEVFTEWFKSAARGQRDALVIDGDGQHAAISILKREPTGEHGLPGPQLKVSTFKVADGYSGQKYEELLLKAIFEQAHTERYTGLLIALVARHDLVAAQEFIDTLGVAIAFHDPGIKGLGLHNTLMPIGTQLLEIVAPITEGTTAERFLLRRKGAGGYMVITQTDDHPPRRATGRGARHPHRRPVRRARLHEHAAAPGRHRRVVPRDRPAGRAARTRWARGARPAGTGSRPSAPTGCRRSPPPRCSARTRTRSPPLVGDHRDRACRRRRRADDPAGERHPALRRDHRRPRRGPRRHRRDVLRTPRSSRPAAEERKLPVADDHVVLVGMRVYLR